MSKSLGAPNSQVDDSILPTRPLLLLKILFKSLKLPFMYTVPTIKLLILSSPLLTKDCVGSLHRLHIFSVQNQGELEMGANSGTFWERVGIFFSIFFFF